MQTLRNNFYYLLVAVLGIAVLFWLKIPQGGIIGLTPQPTAENILGQPLVIKAGKTIAVDSGKIMLTFTDVIQDNRCPSDVQCIVAGQVTVAVSGTENGKDVGTVNLVSGYNKALASHKIDHYAVTVIKVDPSPISTKKLEFKDYSITVIVTR